MLLTTTGHHSGNTVYANFQRLFRPQPTCNTAQHFNFKYEVYSANALLHSSERVTKGFVTFSKRSDIYKRKQMQKGKIQRKVGIVRWRERERERERERKGTGRNQQKAQVRGLAKWSTRAWWMQMTAVTPAREMFDESLVDAAESGDSAFPSGTFQLAEVADHSLSPKHLSSSLWWALPGKDQ